MSLAAQIVDQRVAGIVRDKREIFLEELKVGPQEEKLRSAAFVFLVAKTTLNTTDEDALDGIVEGGNDFGVDSLYYGEPSNGEVAITLVQGKYKKKLDESSNFPENGVTKMIDAIEALFDPEIPVTVNPRLRQRVEEIRSFVAGGAIPRITAVLCNNGPSWTATAQERIDAANAGLAAKCFGVTLVRKRYFLYFKRRSRSKLNFSSPAKRLWSLSILGVSSLGGCLLSNWLSLCKNSAMRC